MTKLPDRRCGLTHESVGNKRVAILVHSSSNINNSSIQPLKCQHLRQRQCVTILYIKGVPFAPKFQEWSQLHISLTRSTNFWAVNIRHILLASFFWFLFYKSTCFVILANLKSTNCVITGTSCIASHRTTIPRLL
jgi:hypothetical protein